MRDFSAYLAAAEEAARRAGANLRAKWDVERKVDIKADESLLTQIDLENERILREYLTGVFPDTEFFGEEGGWGSGGPGGLSWYVDPVDGTTNMVHRFPWVSVSIALVESGIPRVGVVYNPIMEHFFSAMEGGGCYLNGGRVFVSGCSDFSRSLLATGFAVGPSDIGIPNMSNFSRVSLHCHSVRRPGSAALDLACVAAGWLDGFWEMGLKPWDTAAGCVLVREAGGTVTGFEGDCYDPHVSHIIATNGKLHGVLSSYLQKSG